MSGSLGDLVVSVSADIARFTSDMGKIQKTTEDSAKKMGSALESVSGTIGKIGTILTTIAAGAGFAKLINSAVEWNLSAAKMARTMGITTEQASVMEVALHKLGISSDVAESAALKLSRTLSQGTDKFDKYGVTVKDASGNLLPMPQIMANVNQKLLETKTGTDRNIIAMSLYGKSWGELQAILKLTPEAMSEAQATAERLHLVVGPEGAAKSRQYKEGLHEIELVGKSLSIQLGNELLPIITQLTTDMGGPAVTAAEKFGEALRGSFRGVSDAKLWWGKQIDTFSAWVDTGGALGHLFSKNNRSEYAAEKDTIDYMYQRNMENSARKYGNAVKPVSSKAPELGTVEVGNKSAESAANKAESEAKRIAGINEQLAEKTARASKNQFQLIDLEATKYAKQGADKVAIETWVSSEKDKLTKDTMTKSWGLLDDDMDKRAEAADQLRDENAKYITDERNDFSAAVGKKNELDKSVKDQTMQTMADVAQARLTYLGQEESALDLHYEFQTFKLDEEYARKIANAVSAGEETTRIQAEYNALKLQNEEEHAQKTADLWWNNSQKYIGFAQSMTTMGLQMLLFDEGQRSQIGKRMLATSLRFITQGLQAFMFGKAKEHLLNAAAAAGKTSTDTAAALSNLGILNTQAAAWAAYFAAMSLNPYGGQAFIPAATAMTAVAGGAVPAAMASVSAIGATSMIGELGMAAAWGAGGILVGALGEAGATVLEGGTSGATTPAGYGGGSYGSPIITQSTTGTSAQLAPIVNINVYGNIMDHDKFAREIIPSITKAISDGAH